MSLKNITLLLLSFVSLSSMAQEKDTLAVPVLEKKSVIMQRDISNANSAAMKLTKSFEQDESDTQIATDYLMLAEQLLAGGDYVRTEEYLNRALNLFQKEGDREQMALVYRELAKVQELRGNITSAITSFDEASKLTRKRTFRKINENDAERLRNLNNPKKQEVLIEKNINLLAEADMSNTLSGVNVKEEMAVAYKQMAMTQSSEEGKDLFLNMSENKSAVVDKTIAYTKEKLNIDAVEGINIKNVSEQNDEREQNVEELKIVVEGSSPTSTESLEAAYAISVSGIFPVEAYDIVIELAERYIREDKKDKALELYSDYVSRLETAMKRDSISFQDNIFLLMEDKISQLEKERELQGELITRKNRFSYALLGFIVVVMFFLVLIARALYAIKKKNKRIALQSLRREMNPHFIFNSLNSVNQFIAQNNEREANKYLSSYSKLMRNIMENSNKDFIRLDAELEQLREYLDLEHMRFSEKFDYEIFIDQRLDVDTLYVPNMIIQPQLENAIWHGLRYLDNKGFLQLKFIEEDSGRVCVYIEDNGIGLRKSKALKTNHQKKYQSRGLNNTHERIKLLNDLYSVDLSIDIKEKIDPDCGVVVSICFPKLNSQISFSEGDKI